MSADLSSLMVDSYQLINSTFIFKSDCPICFKSNQDLFSFHLVPQEIYQKEIHGEIKINGSLKGIFKTIEVETPDEAGLTSKKTFSLFCQVAKDKKDGKAHLFSPLHGACTPCIAKVQAICPYKCPMCRLKIKTEPIPKPPKERVISSTRRYTTISQHDHLDFDLDDMMYGGKKGFYDLSRSKRKIAANRLTKAYNQYSASQLLEDLDEDII